MLFRHRYTRRDHMYDGRHKIQEWGKRMESVKATGGFKYAGMSYILN